LDSGVVAPAIVALVKLAVCDPILTKAGDPASAP
jgi:hypothetical protein